PRPAASKQAERRPLRDVECHVVEDLAVLERLRHVLQADGFHQTFTGNTTKISFTSTTLTRMMQIDDSTTLLVDARPTPSVPCVVVKPRYDDTVPMMKPNTIVFSVAGRKSLNSTTDNARWK